MRVPEGKSSLITEFKALGTASNCQSPSFLTTCPITGHNYWYKCNRNDLFGKHQTMEEIIQCNLCIHFSYGADANTLNGRRVFSEEMSFSTVAHMVMCSWLWHSLVSENLSIQQWLNHPVLGPSLPPLYSEPASLTLFLFLALPLYWLLSYDRSLFFFNWLPHIQFLA